jgi:DNA-binding response OmpR family regulator
MTHHFASHGTILVVEDDPALRELMALWLRTEGFKVRVAGNGQEALASMRVEVPCALVVDLNMPVMDGAEFRRRQQRIDRLADVPFFLVSAAEDSDRIGRALDVTEVIPKPFDSTRLLAAINAHCD